MPPQVGAPPVRQIEPDSYLTRTRAAEVLTAAGIPCTRTTLEQLAVQGRGPRYGIVNGRAIYPRSSLAEWIHSRLNQGNAA